MTLARDAEAQRAAFALRAEREPACRARWASLAARRAVLAQALAGRLDMMGLEVPPPESAAGDLGAAERAFVAALRDAAASAEPAEVRSQLAAHLPETEAIAAAVGELLGEPGANVGRRPEPSRRPPGAVP